MPAPLVADVTPAVTPTPAAAVDVVTAAAEDGGTTAAAPAPVVDVAGVQQEALLPRTGAGSATTTAAAFAIGLIGLGLWLRRRATA